MSRLKVRVTPRASRDEVSGWSGDELIVRVTETPERGRANEAVIAVIARALGVPRRSVRLCAGATSRHKVLEVDGIDERSASEALGALRAPARTDAAAGRSGPVGRES